MSQVKVGRGRICPILDPKFALFGEFQGKFRFRNKVNGSLLENLKLGLDIGWHELRYGILAMNASTVNCKRDRVILRRRYRARSKNPERDPSPLRGSG